MTFEEFKANYNSGFIDRIERDSCGILSKCWNAAHAEGVEQGKADQREADAETALPSHLIVKSETGPGTYRDGYESGYAQGRGDAAADILNTTAIRDAGKAGEEDRD